MKVFKFFFLLNVSTLLILSYCLPVSAKICNRIVAAVNNEIITLYELNGRIIEITGTDPSELEHIDKTGFIETRRNVLDLLIDEKITHDKIMELGMEATPKELDAAIENIKARNNWTHEDLVEVMKGEGTSVEQYKKNIKKEMEQMRLIDFEVKSKIIISDDDIKKYYDDHVDGFKNEEKVRLSIILLTEERHATQNEGLSLAQKVEEVVSRLKKGEDFGVLAMEFSQGPGAKDGGDLGFIKTSNLDPKLKNIIDDMDVGRISKPIFMPSGVQIIKLVEKHDKGVKKLEDVKGYIYDTLYREEINKRFLIWIKELRKKAFIKVIF